GHSGLDWRRPAGPRPGPLPPVAEEEVGRNEPQSHREQRNKNTENSLCSCFFVLCDSAVRFSYFQRNHFSATKNVTTAYAARIASRQAMSVNDFPSSITSRSASLICVSGSAWMKGWAASGNRFAEKKIPLKSHCTSVTS